MSRVAEQQSVRPNIIFALADDLGWNGVGYNGGEAHTPNLNEMSQSSGTVRLERHYSGSPVCSPTRGTVLTGRNHNRYCIWGVNSYSLARGDFNTVQRYPLPQTETSVASVLKRFGYSTACFGKWHLGNFKRPINANNPAEVSHPGLHGFDQWWATESSASTSYLNCGCFIDTANMNKHCRKGCSNYHSSDTNGSIINWSNAIVEEDDLFIWELAEKFIRTQVNLKTPFFLYLPFHNVHAPIVTTDKYTSWYRSNFTSNFTEHEEKRINYLGSISALDDAIGLLRGLLKELKVNNNTIFWFTSDNGPTAQHQGRLRGYKKTYYEGGIQVPELIEWPDVIDKNRKSKFSVVTNDFLPTVYDILGTNPIDDQPLDGISILPFLQRKVIKLKRYIIWAKADNNGGKLKWRTVSIANQNYKLIANYDKEGANNMINYELFNLNTDEEETTNLAANGTTLYDPIIRKFQRRIRKWQQSVEESTKKHCLSN